MDTILKDLIERKILNLICINGDKKLTAIERGTLFFGNEYILIENCIYKEGVLLFYEEDLKSMVVEVEEVEVIEEELPSLGLMVRSETYLKAYDLDQRRASNAYDEVADILYAHRDKLDDNYFYDLAGKLFTYGSLRDFFYDKIIDGEIIDAKFPVEVVAEYFNRIKDVNTIKGYLLNLAIPTPSYGQDPLVIERNTQREEYVSELYGKLKYLNRKTVEIAKRNILKLPPYLLSGMQNYTSLPISVIKKKKLFSTPSLVTKLEPFEAEPVYKTHILNLNGLDTKIDGTYFSEYIASYLYQVTDQVFYVTDKLHFLNYDIYTCLKNADYPSQIPLSTILNFPEIGDEVVYYTMFSSHLIDDIQGIVETGKIIDIVVLAEKYGYQKLNHYDNITIWFTLERYLSKINFYKKEYELNKAFIRKRHVTSPKREDVYHHQ